jgi:hypothetical protein
MFLLFFASAFNFCKVASYLGEVDTQGVEHGFASICDVVGNALADEADELAAKLVRPMPTI